MAFLRSTPRARHGLAWFLATLLAACSGRHGDAQQASAPSGPDSAQQDAASTAECEGHVLVKAMPPKATIGGLPFKRWSCTFNAITAIYGDDNGREVDVSLTDTRSPGLDKPDVAPGVKATFERQRNMTKATLQMMLDTIDGMKANPELLPAYGGPDYLSVALPEPTGDRLVIEVPRKDDGGPVQVVALPRDRYVLGIQAKDHGTAVGGMTASQAQALYDPFIKAYHPERLP
ncbi:hypothetical protein [Dyella sp.]|uniref:hypothetical protein n=1 Tax=Dyella sp. TaxID=1869338 RepID=UPI002ED15B19